MPCNDGTHFPGCPALYQVYGVGGSGLHSHTSSMPTGFRVSLRCTGHPMGACTCAEKIEISRERRLEEEVVRLRDRIEQLEARSGMCNNG